MNDIPYIIEINTIPGLSNESIIPKQAKELEQRAYNRRERMERQERNKKGYKNKPRKDTKKESIRMTEADLREVIRNVLSEELSKKTKETLKKKKESLCSYIF